MRHSGQNWSREAEAMNMTTPISRIIIVENYTSATTLLTALHAASAASAAMMPSELDSFTLFPSSSSLDEDALPPPKEIICWILTEKKSDDELVVSGNDSATWEKEDEQMRYVILAQAEAKGMQMISQKTMTQ